MDPRRLLLHDILEELLPTGKKAYFQPPANVQMEYPAIVYERDTANTQFAGNSPYRYTKRYQVTVIVGDPDSDIPGKVAKLPMCTMNRHFTADNLNHDVFDLYF